MLEDVAEKLEPPPRTSLDDPGAHDLESSDSEDHFSDAYSAPQHSPNSLVPVTRVEKVDNEPCYGEVPGTEAYNMRAEDARPDQVAVIPDNEYNALEEISDCPLTPGGHPIPRTVVEKIDPSLPSYGEFPGTSAHEARKADAVPDLVLKAGRSLDSTPRSRSGSTPGDLPIPITKVEKVDSIPSHGEVPGTKAYEIRKGDAQPDIVKEVGDVQGKKPVSLCTLCERVVTKSGAPTSSATRSPTISHSRQRSSVSKKAPVGHASSASLTLGNERLDGEDGEGLGDDFDDFEKGEDAEFGDFNDGFQDAEVAPPLSAQSLPTIAPSFPVLNFDNLDASDEVLAAIMPYIEALFPSDTTDTSIPPQPVYDNPIFLTQRSASLWSQLVEPPPLQPPNWIRSRIRRLFLVSLGVPVDLDEILPASKQKKLILPSVNLHSTSPRTSTDSRNAGSVSHLRQGDANASNTSVDSQDKSSHSKRRKGPLPPPELDLVAARQLCTITNEALNGMTAEELREHVAKLEGMQEAAKEILGYWAKKTDEKIGDREAFEGVIENLVKHARKVRK